MTSQLQPLILHYHIFKNAGTSFNWSLHQYFGDRFFEYDHPVASEVLTGGELSQFIAGHPQALALSSHQALFPVPQIEGRQIFATLLLRDPIARIRSIYSFERIQNVQSPGAIKAKELDFKKYVEWRLEATPAMLCNFQVHFCSRTRETKGFTPGEDQFHLAVTYLQKAKVVGTVERYREWIALAEALFRPHFPELNLQTAEMNVTARETSGDKSKLIDRLSLELGDELVDRLLEANQLDMRLHQVADAMLSQDLAIQNVANSLQKAYRETRPVPSLPAQEVSVR